MSYDRSIVMTVVADILGMVQRKELPLGSALPNEADLCARFQASRTRVREAVKYLQGKGFLRVEHGRGTWIEPLEHWDLLDADLWLTALKVGNRTALISNLVEIRRILEIRTAELAAANRTPEQLQSLENDLVVMEAALTEQNAAAYNRTARRFHDHLAIATGNMLLLRMTRALAQGLDLTKQFGDDSREVLYHSFKEHQAIFSAVKNRNAEEASAALSRHLQDFEKSVRRQINNSEIVF
ncbi:MAG: FadR family transcriptional regulator [Actinomycetota bacterium]|nr:MAG: FadR family transcriptional regulator [Actinomycetota bacterium]